MIYRNTRIHTHIFSLHFESVKKFIFSEFIFKDYIFKRIKNVDCKSHLANHLNKTKFMYYYIYIIKSLIVLLHFTDKLVFLSNGLG